MAGNIRPQAENIETDSDWVLRVGVDKSKKLDQFLIQFWIKKPDRDTGGSFVFVDPKLFADGIVSGKYDGINWRDGNPRKLVLMGVETPRTTVLNNYPDSDSVEVAVDSEVLKSVVRKYVNLLLNS